jgi:hypothetical protein
MGVAKTVHRTDVLDDPTYWQPLLGRPSNTLVPPEDTTFNSKSYGSDNDHTNTAMFCRITKQHLFQVVEEEKEGGGPTSQQEADRLVCVSIVNDKEDDDFALDEYLSEKFYHRHKAAISHDDMFVSMTGIAVQTKSRTLTGNENTVIKVVQAPIEHERRMAGITKGNYTLAIVRVSTRDAQLVVSTQELEEEVLSESDDAVNVITQYRAMSFGQFQLHSKGVYDVFIDQNISEFATATTMLDTINEAAVQQFGVGHMRELADYVNICHPIGLEPFVAFTYRYAWRAHYSNHWCASLSATYVFILFCAFN